MNRFHGIDIDSHRGREGFKTERSFRVQKSPDDFPIVRPEAVLVYSEPHRNFPYVGFPYVAPARSRSRVARSIENAQRLPRNSGGYGPVFECGIESFLRRFGKPVDFVYEKEVSVTELDQELNELVGGIHDRP